MGWSYLMGPVLFGGMALSLQTGSSRETESERGSEIVITGRSGSPERTARRFVQKVVEMDEGPLARFADPICMEITGLPERPAAAIAARLTAVARRAEIKVAGKGCKPNLMIFFVVDAEAFIRVAKRRDRLALADLSDGNRMGALRPGPVRSWRAIELRDEAGAAAIPGAIGETPPTFEGSARAVTVNAVLVIDRSVAPGKTFVQIADYAAMRMLAGASAPARGLGGTDTILSLFDPAVTPPPAGMSDLDARMLAGLYSMPDTGGDAFDQSNDLARGMARERKAGD